MIPWLTVERLNRMKVLLRLGDIFYLPQPNYRHDQISADLKPVINNPFLWERIRPDYAPTKFEKERPSPLMLPLLSYAYEDHLAIHGFKEPDWIWLLSSNLQRHVRLQIMYSDFYPGPELLCQPFGIPFAGIYGAILNGGLVEDTFKRFPRLNRLWRIRQLGYLQDPVVSSQGTKGLGLHFNHTRFGHTIQVLLAATLIAVNNRLPAASLHALQAAALLHDILTPAGGDTTKAIDPRAFDEDAHFGRFLKKQNWTRLAKTYEITPEALTDTVEGKGVLGTILDIADKIGYLGQDAEIYRQRYYPNNLFGFSEGYETVARLLRQNPSICGIWDAVRVQDNMVVVTDPKRLFDFLMLRVLLFKNFYYHPGSRFKEFLIAHVITRYLYETRALTKNQLLAMTDPDLERKIEAVTGQKHVLNLLNTSEQVYVQTFKNRHDAYQQEARLNQSGVSFTMVEKLPQIRTETHYRVPDQCGVPRPFSDAYPDMTQALEQAATMTESICLYYVPLSQLGLKENFVAAFTAYKKRKIHERI